MIRSVTVYCSSSNHAPSAFFDVAAELGHGLALRGIDLVFGGGRVGLMGRVADAVMNAGGRVRGIIPRFLEEKELAHELMEILTWKHLGHHRKPILLLNVDGFWEPLLVFFDRIARDNMVGADHSKHYTVCRTTDDVFTFFDHYKEV